jgi:hypothetical protein
VGLHLCGFLYRTQCHLAKGTRHLPSRCAVLCPAGVAGEAGADASSPNCYVFNIFVYTERVHPTSVLCYVLQGWRARRARRQEAKAQVEACPQQRL